MLLFIQAEKLLHHHKAETACHHEQVQCLKSLNSSCSICEFQIEREAQLPDVLIPRSPVEFVNNEFVSKDFSFQHNFLSSIPGRGPPALVLL